MTDFDDLLGLRRSIEFYYSRGCSFHAIVFFAENKLSRIKSIDRPINVELFVLKIIEDYELMRKATG